MFRILIAVAVIWATFYWIESHRMDSTLDAYRRECVLSATRARDTDYCRHLETEFHEAHQGVDFLTFHKDSP